MTEGREKSRVLMGPPRQRVGKKRACTSLRGGLTRGAVLPQHQMKKRKEIGRDLAGRGIRGKKL